MQHFPDKQSVFAYRNDKQATVLDRATVTTQFWREHQPDALITGTFEQVIQRQPGRGGRGTWPLSADLYSMVMSVSAEVGVKPEQTSAFVPDANIKYTV